MFRPIKKSLPMVSALDIGRTAASLILAESGTRRIVELHGPQDYSPTDAANIFSALLNRPIQAVDDNDSDWSAVMLGNGFPSMTVTAFVDMFAGFNSGLIAFEETHETRRGQVSLHEALAAILKSTAPH
jgi:uncharacterized protein YbjT (DUF2867 family)